MLAVRYPLSTPRGITSVIGKAKGEPVCSLVFVLVCGSSGLRASHQQCPLNLFSPWPLPRTDSGPLTLNTKIRPHRRESGTARGTDHAPPREHMRHALHERTGDSALSATESRIHDAPGHPPPPPCARRAVLASVRSPFTSGVRRPLIRVTGGLFPFRAWAGWQGARAAGAGNPVGLVGVVVCVDFIPKSNTCKTGWFFRERVVGRSRTSSFSMCHCRF